MKYIATSLLRNFWYTEHSVRKSEFTALNTSSGSQSDNLIKFSMSGRFFSNQFGEEVWASALDRLNLKFNLRNMFEVAGRLGELTLGLEPRNTVSELNFVWLSRLFLSQQQINWGMSGRVSRGTLPYTTNFLSIQMLRRALLFGRVKSSLHPLYFGGYAFDCSPEAYLPAPTFKSKLSSCRGSTGGRFFLLWELAHWTPNSSASGLVYGGVCLSSLNLDLTGRLYFLRTVTRINRECLNFTHNSLVSLSRIFFCWLSFSILVAGCAKQIASILFEGGGLHISANQIFFNHGPWFDRLVVSPVFRKSKVACGANFWGELNWPKVNILVAIEKYISQSYRFDPRNSLSFYTRKFARLFDWFSLLLGCSSPYTGKGNKFVSVGLSLSRTRKYSFKNIGTRDRFSGFADLAAFRYSLAAYLFASLGPQFLGMTCASWLSGNDLSFNFNYKGFFYLRRILGDINLYNREVLSNYTRISRVGAPEIKAFTASSYYDEAPICVLDFRPSSIAWLSAQHTLWFLNVPKMGVSSGAGFWSLSYENRMAAFSNIGCGGVHADFFFFNSFETLGIMRTFLSETVLASGVFKLDSLFDSGRPQFLTLDVFGSASTCMLKSMIYRDSGNSPVAALSRLVYHSNGSMSFLNFPWNRRRFFFNSLDSDRACSSGSFVRGGASSACAFSGVSVALSSRALTFRFWNIANMRKRISLRRLHFKRKRLHTSARLYWGYKFELAFYEF